MSEEKQTRAEKFEEFVDETTDHVLSAADEIGGVKVAELSVLFTTGIMLANALHDVADAIRSKA